MTPAERRNAIEGALDFRPFDGDETDTTLLSDKIVTGRKAYVCQTCDGPIQPGERQRAMVETNNEDKQIMTFRWCRICCRAMAQAFDYGRFTVSGPERLIESRDRLGERRRAKKRGGVA